MNRQIEAGQWACQVHVPVGRRDSDRQQATRDLPSLGIGIGTGSVSASLRDTGVYRGDTPLVEAVYYDYEALLKVGT